MTGQQVVRLLDFPDNAQASALYGDLNKNLLTIEQSTGIKIHARGAQVRISGFDYEADLIVNLLEQLYDLVGQKYPLYPADIVFGLKILEKDPNANIAKIFLDKVYVTTQNKIISPKTPNQKHYIDTLRNSDIVFAIGPAGTGKTYLAVAMAAAALASGQIQSVVLTRPAVEAGEKLGFLPGDLAQKVNPYLRPLLDSLADLLGAEKAINLLEQEIIEIAPLAFMRGRTLSNAFIILDEAQNTTREQMKMFLTRIGFDSRVVITGDITQIDLPDRQKSGLLEAQRLLSKIEDIQFCNFTKNDIVRHPLVQKIIDAYEKQ